MAMVCYKLSLMDETCVGTELFNKTKMCKKVMLYYLQAYIHYCMQTNENTIQLDLHGLVEGVLAFKKQAKQLRFSHSRTVRECWAVMFLKCYFVYSVSYK